MRKVGAFLHAHRFELAFLAVMGGLLFYLSWILPFNEAPDEETRYLIPLYIYRHGTLPVGQDPEIQNEIWGISYAYHPILPYILGGYLMKLVSVFNRSDKALLMAARFVNILFGVGFYWYVLQLAKKLFASRLSRCYFIALLALLPQLLYLFVYVNTDGIALFSSAMILNYWLEGLSSRWDRRSCTGLAVGVAVCAQSYYNAYGYALMSVVLFAASLLFFFRKSGARVCAAVILKRGIFITAIVFLLSGWWFIRCGILYHGDFLGLHASEPYAEEYAMDEYKPSNKQSLKEQGVSLEEMLKPESEGGMSWIETTYRSLIGYFGYLRYPLGLDIYEIHLRLWAIGLLGLLLQGLVLIARFVCRRIPETAKRICGRQSGEELPEKEGRRREKGRLEKEAAATDSGSACFAVLQFSLVCCIIIPVLLSLYYSYTSDFQPQGRYVMPMIVPLMYFTAVGTERLITLTCRRWFGRLLMIPLFYAALHVFLAAFVSVYLPTYAEGMQSLSSVRFLWLSNIGLLDRLLGLLLPG